MIKIKIYKAAIIALIIIAVFAACRNYKEYLYIMEAGRALAAFESKERNEAAISTSSLVEKLLSYEGLGIISINSRDSGLQAVKVEYDGSMNKAVSMLNEISIIAGVIAVKSINQAVSGDKSKISAEIIYLSNIVCK